MPINKDTNLEVLIMFWYLNQKLWIVSDTDLLILERSGIRKNCPATTEFLVIAVDGWIPVDVYAFDCRAQLSPFHLVYIRCVSRHIR
jgi:hypothetical protein